MEWTKDKETVRHQVNLVVWNALTIEGPYASPQVIMDNVKSNYQAAWDETGVSDAQLKVWILEELLDDANSSLNSEMMGNVFEDFQNLTVE